MVKPGKASDMIYHGFIVYITKSFNFNQRVQTVLYPLYVVVQYGGTVGCSWDCPSIVYFTTQNTTHCLRFRLSIDSNVKIVCRKKNISVNAKTSPLYCLHLTGSYLQGISNHVQLKRNEKQSTMEESTPFDSCFCLCG